VDRSPARGGGCSIQKAGPHWRMNTLNQALLLRSCFRYALVFLASVLLSSCFSKGGPKLGDRAPAFELRSLEGSLLRFVPASGKVHVLYFWADWCARCEDDFRLMDELYGKWQKESESPSFLAVDVGQTDEHVRNFVKRLKTSFPIYMDHDGKVARSFGVKGLPTYFITDGKGVIRHIILGWADEKALLEEINKIKQR
jgi:peroxiredoxin